MRSTTLLQHPPQSGLPHPALAGVQPSLVHPSRHVHSIPAGCTASSSCGPPVWPAPQKPLQAGPTISLHMGILGYGLNDHCTGAATSIADGSTPVAPTPRPQHMYEPGHNDGTAGTQRVTQCHCSTMDIHPAAGNDSQHVSVE
jgi:hypothetical protein